MYQKRGRDRRTRDLGPPNSSQERRCIAERRRIKVSEASLDEFEALMSALGFRNSNPGNTRH